jgi:hypothetical protein
MSQLKKDWKEIQISCRKTRFPISFDGDNYKLFNYLIDTTKKDFDFSGQFGKWKILNILWNN